MLRIQGVPQKVRYHSCLLLLIMVPIGVVGCSKSEPEPLKSEILSAAQDVDASEVAAGYDISSQEATEWANEWAQAIVGNQSGTIDRLFDWEGLYERAVDPLNLSSRDRESFEKGLREGNIGSNISSQIAMACAKGGSYRLVRLVRRDGVLHAVFRFQSLQTGINYHDMRLVRKDREIIGDRLFVAISGEELADTIRALALPTVKSNAVREESAEKTEDAAALESIYKMLVSARAGETETTKRIYEGLPDRYQNSKNALLAMIMAKSAFESEEEYLAIIDQYSTNFPNDPSLGLVVIDAAIGRKDWDLLETCRQRIQAWTGGDDFIDLMVAATLARGGELERANELSKGIDPAPLMIAPAHDFKLAIALSNNDHPTVLQQLRILRDSYGLKIPGVETAPYFASFRESREYQQWVAP
jgi:hypothetical protein